MSENNPYAKPPQDGDGQQPPQGQQPQDQPPPGHGYPQQGPGAPWQGYGGPPTGHYPPPPGTYTGDPAAPYGYDIHGRPYSDKQKLVAGLLQIFVGGLGVGRFYTGHYGIAVAQLLTCGGLGVWALIDGILFLTSNDRTDSQGRILRA
ncbi:TM2 domain-containing protein [Streptomyces beijiangensis]|uniref:TM2 domain-containing protein n=1 Tax=Streptomyces beijiangensis TaxID=163361 RepID=A0A939JLV9_9ACTN|nr:TM2 domain-containing protein [Streptomyces beijiangensis]MBO0516139.1 TM2 domain-containing protein [Streptomyces beijiangensis]